MIFSHAPAGYIITFLSSKFNKIKFTKKQTLWIFLFGVIFSIFPDLDLFYYYFISTSETHRALITHTPILYVAIFLILFLYSYFKKNEFTRLISFVILFSSLSHLLLDSLGSGVAWLYPLSKLPYGFLSISSFGNGFYGQNFFAINYSAEILIFTIFLNLIVFSKFKRVKNIFIITTSLFAIILVSVLFYLNQHMFSINSNHYYGDIDSDGIMNMKDLDMDGDNILNIEDLDANSNEVNNIDDLVKTSERMEEVYHDKTEDGLYGLFSRFGLLSNIDVVYKSYDYAGIFLKNEMVEDFQEKPEGYIGEPENDYLFSDRAENLYNYCLHKDLFINDNLEIGDMVFYENDNINHVSLLIEKPNLVLDAGVESKAIKTEIENVEKKYGDTIYYCRVLN
ncbi:MAG: metal-dependent hydrolase [Parcubacteria group bacterium]|nr:metal-dependent hydrolase [Parcubacteria group bacterium]